MEAESRTSSKPLSGHSSGLSHVKSMPNLHHHAAGGDKDRAVSFKVKEDDKKKGFAGFLARSTGKKHAPPVPLKPHHSSLQPGRSILLQPSPGGTDASWSTTPLSTGQLLPSSEQVEPMDEVDLYRHAIAPHFGLNQKPEGLFPSTAGHTHRHSSGGHPSFHRQHSSNPPTGKGHKPYDSWEAYTASAYTQGLRESRSAPPTAPGLAATLPLVVTKPSSRSPAHNEFYGFIDALETWSSPRRAPAPPGSAQEHAGLGFVTPTISIRKPSLAPTDDSGALGSAGLSRSQSLQHSKEDRLHEWLQTGRTGRRRSSTTGDIDSPSALATSFAPTATATVTVAQSHRPKKLAPCPLERFETLEEFPFFDPAAAGANSFLTTASSTATEVTVKNEPDKSAAYDGLAEEGGDSEVEPASKFSDDGSSESSIASNRARALGRRGLLYVGTDAVPSMSMERVESDELRSSPTRAYIPRSRSPGLQPLQLLDGTINGHRPRPASIYSLGEVAGEALEVLGVIKDDKSEGSCPTPDFRTAMSGTPVMRNAGTQYDPPQGAVRSGGSSFLLKRSDHLFTPSPPASLLSDEDDDEQRSGSPTGSLVADDLENSKIVSMVDVQPADDPSAPMFAFRTSMAPVKASYLPRAEAFRTPPRTPPRRKRSLSEPSLLPASSPPKRSNETSPALSLSPDRSISSMNTYSTKASSLDNNQVNEELLARNELLELRVQKLSKVIKFLTTFGG